jgi:hypothetical protein
MLTLGVCVHAGIASGLCMLRMPVDTRLCETRPGLLFKLNGKLERISSLAHAPKAPCANGRPS